MTVFKTFIISFLSVIFVGLSIACFDSANAMVQKVTTESLETPLETTTYIKTLASVSNAASTRWPLQYQPSNYSYSTLQSLDDTSLQQIYLISATIACIGLLCLFQAPLYYLSLVRSIRGEGALARLTEVDSVMQNS